MDINPYAFKIHQPKVLTHIIPPTMPHKHATSNKKGITTTPPPPSPALLSTPKADLHPQSLQETLAVPVPPIHTRSCVSSGVNSLARCLPTSIKINLDPNSSTSTPTNSADRVSSILPVHFGPNSLLVTPSVTVQSSDPTAVSFLVPDLPRTKPQKKESTTQRLPRQRR